MQEAATADANSPPYPHSTSVNALSTLSPLPSQRLRDASRRWPYRDVKYLCDEFGPRSDIESRNTVVLSFGSDARIILRAESASKRYGSQLIAEN